jgi:hypothetical protein
MYTLVPWLRTMLSHCGLVGIQVTANGDDEDGAI